MKCFKHAPKDAVAVCAHCGRALCLECVAMPTAPQITCSPECQAALERDAQALRRLLDKSAQSARASAFYCYLTGGLSAAAAVAAWFIFNVPFLIYFTGGCAVVLVLAGIWHQRGAK